MPRTYDVFVSYSRDDKARVVPWVEELKKGGVTAFFDTESLLGGTQWQNEIVEAIRTAKLVILFVSRASVDSEFVPKELALSLDMKKNILPVLLEETEIRGQMAFCIAGLQRVAAYNQDDPAKTLRDIQAALHHRDIEWKSPTRGLNGVLRESRDVSLDDGKGNVRLNRKPEPAAVPAAKAEASSRESAPEGRWVRRWLMLMAVAGSVGLFFWMDGAAWFDSKPIAPEPPKPELVETVEDEAVGRAKNFYLSANHGPDAQLEFVAEKVDYLDHQGATRSAVKAEIEADAEKWTSQHIDVLEPVAVRVIEVGKLVECDVPLRCTRENEVVKNVSTLTGRLRLQMIGSELKIVAVSEVAGTRKVESLKFLAEGQEKAVREFIARAVCSGSSSSSSGMTPDAIAAMYVERPEYLARVATHAEIAKETGRLIDLWEVRDYKLLEGPEVLSGLGTPNVEVRAALEFHVSSPARGKSSQGWVRSSYVVHFDDEGVPLIQKHAEIDRGQ